MQTCVFLLNRGIILLIDFKFLRLPGTGNRICEIITKGVELVNGFATYERFIF